MTTLEVVKSCPKYNDPKFKNDDPVRCKKADTMTMILYDYDVVKKADTMTTPSK